MKKLIVATNLTDLHKGPSFLDELLTQIVNGSTVEVLEETNDKWARVREEGGYEGFAYRPYLAEVEPPRITHITRSMICLYSRPEYSESARLGGTLLSIGTFVQVLENAISKTRHEFARIRLSGNMLPEGWIPHRSLESLSVLPLPADRVRERIISIARNFSGVYYLWGANTQWGTDCSGLVMMSHRLAGYTVPRDAWMQHRDARKIESAQPGDLFFFHNDARTKISHVGICTGGWNMIHSSRARNGVYEEDIEKNPNLMSSYAGAGTFLP